MPHYALRFGATRPSFEQAAVDFRAALAASGSSDRARRNAELIFEEVVSNVIRHGDAHALEVSLSGEADGHGMVLTFEDDGPPFDPLEWTMPPLPTSIEKASLGGLGLLLVRKASTQLHYERTPDRKNRLIVAIASS